MMIFQIMIIIRQIIICEPTYKYQTDNFKLDNNNLIINNWIII